MKKGNVGMLALLRVVVLMLVLCVPSSSSLSSSSGSYFEQKQNRRKSLVPTQTTSSLTLNRVGSSIVFPVHGNVYPIGFYNVTLNIGQPSKPYFVDPDTGSDLTWLQCDAPCAHCTKTLHPLYRPSRPENKVPCKDPLCQSLHPPEHRCETPEQCDYELNYVDGSSTLGVLVKDDFSFNFTSGEQFKPSLALGCGYDQIDGKYPHPFDGVLGLGKGKSSIVSQLSRLGFIKNVIGHCLSVRGGGYLFFGDDLYDSSRVMWTSMSRDLPEHYSPGYAELIYGGKTTGIKNLPTVFDSGSSYTYLVSLAYNALTSLVKKELSGRSLSEVSDDDHTLTHCWRGKKPFKSLQDVKKYFKPLALSFTNGGKAKAKFEMPPEAYLIISRKGNVCLGILDGGENVNIIGDISMQDKLVIYNNEKQLIGWMPENCDRLPKYKTTSMW